VNEASAITDDDDDDVIRRVEMEIAVIVDEDFTLSGNRISTPDSGNTSVSTIVGDVQFTVSR